MRYIDVAKSKSGHIFISCKGGNHNSGILRMDKSLDWIKGPVNTPRRG